MDQLFEKVLTFVFFSNFLFLHKDVYCKNTRIYKNISGKDIKDFGFYDYSHSPSRAKKDFYQALSRYSTSALKNDVVYAH